MSEVIEFPPQSVEGLEDFAIEVELELDTLCAGLMEQGIPPIYLVGMLQSQIHYILAALQEEDEE
jgi:hypothetical protein